MVESWRRGVSVSTSNLQGILSFERSKPGSSAEGYLEFRRSSENFLQHFSVRFTSRKGILILRLKHNSFMSHIVCVSCVHRRLFRRIFCSNLAPKELPKTFCAHQFKKVRCLWLKKNCLNKGATALLPLLLRCLRMFQKPIK